MTDETTAEMPIEPLPETAVEGTQPETVELPDDAGLPEDKPKGGFQRRIKELADERNHWRELAMRAQPEPTPEPPKVEVPTRLPKLEDFGFDEAQYQAALIQHATSLARAEARKEIEEDRKRLNEERRFSTFAERQAAFSKTTPDFAEKVLNDRTLPITEPMKEVILDSESGPEVAYWLANNREKAAQIARLPPHLAALEMGRIEGRLQAVKEAKARTPVVTQTPAPPPSINAVEPEVDKDPDSMSMNEWLKWREKGLKRKR